MVAVLEKEIGVRLALSGMLGEVRFNGDRGFVKALLKRWLIPGKCVVVREVEQGVSFCLEQPEDIETAKLGFRVLRRDLEMGLQSQYFAERVLEKWGMMAEEKLRCVKRRLTDEECATLDALRLKALFVEERGIAYLVRMVRRMHYGVCRRLNVCVDTPVGMEWREGIIKKNVQDAWYQCGDVGYVEL